MRNKGFALAIALALTAIPAQAEKLSSFELNKLKGWGEALAVCDITRFLLTRPELGADVILAAGHDNTYVALSQPLYTPPEWFFSETMHKAYYRLRDAKEVTFEDYTKARVRLASPMYEAWLGATMAEREAIREQMDLCYHLAAKAGVPMATKN